MSQQPLTADMHQNLTHARNWCAGALTVLASGNIHEAAWRAKEAIKHLESVIAIVEPTPRDDVIKLKDDQNKTLRQENARLHRRAEQLEESLATVSAALNAQEAFR